jgi:hypothetical protein
MSPDPSPSDLNFETPGLLLSAVAPQNPQNHPTLRTFGLAGHVIHQYRANPFTSTSNISDSLLDANVSISGNVLVDAISFHVNCGELSSAISQPAGNNLTLIATPLGNNTVGIVRKLVRLLIFFFIAICSFLRGLMYLSFRPKSSMATYDTLVGNYRFFGAACMLCMVISTPVP